MTEKKGFGKSILNNKIALYVTIGIIGLIAISLFIVTNDEPMEDPSISNQVEESKKIAIERFQKQFCGIDSKPNSNGYVTEILLPGKCEMPLGVVVDAEESKVWYLSTKDGLLGSFDLKNQRFDDE
ncbi:MAG: putative streptogramin lyase, partial [Nitrososphaeraceae archaeon]|nr:putative streptogramin lyase [Nitrososphaeraceae archaeon]